MKHEPHEFQGRGEECARCDRPRNHKLHVNLQTSSSGMSSYTIEQATSPAVMSPGAGKTETVNLPVSQDSVLWSPIAVPHPRVNDAAPASEATLGELIARGHELDRKLVGEMQQVGVKASIPGGPEPEPAEVCRQPNRWLYLHPDGWGVSEDEFASLRGLCGKIEAVIPDGPVLLFRCSDGTRPYVRFRWPGRVWEILAGDECCEAEAKFDADAQRRNDFTTQIRQVNERLAREQAQGLCIHCKEKPAVYGLDMVNPSLAFCSHECNEKYQSQGINFIRVEPLTGTLQDDFAKMASPSLSITVPLPAVTLKHGKIYRMTIAPVGDDESDLPLTVDQWITIDKHGRCVVSHYSHPPKWSIRPDLDGVEDRLGMSRAEIHRQNGLDGVSCCAMYPFESCPNCTYRFGNP